MNQNVSTNGASTSQHPASDSISRRAYEIWQQEGCPEGSDLRHWLQAEQEFSGRRDGVGSAAPGVASSRPSATDARPLQGTRAGDAMARQTKRASQSPFASDKTPANSRAKLETAGRRRG